MPELKHEAKICPRCNSHFECKAGDIAHCQCNHVQLPEKVYDFIHMKFNDCLCVKCLQQLLQPHYLAMEQLNNFKDR